MQHDPDVDAVHDTDEFQVLTTAMIPYVRYGAGEQRMHASVADFVRVARHEAMSPRAILGALRRARVYPGTPTGADGPSRRYAKVLDVLLFGLLNEK